tara:strand:+ start:3346 stop:3594 length:249 start_codon:yes stop_codon:yes gene_type:complete
MVVRCLDVNFSDALTANQFGFANQDINSNLIVIWVNHSRHMYHIQTAQISGRSFLNIYGLTFIFIGITGFRYFYQLVDKLVS